MKKHLMRVSGMFVLGIIAIGLVAGASFAGDAVTASPVQRTEGAAAEYANVKPMPLPQASQSGVAAATLESAAVEYPGPPTFHKGNKGTGVMTPETLPESMVTPDIGGSDEAITPQASGSLNHPFTTSRVDVLQAGHSISSRYPYRAAGKLYFKIGQSSYVCSGSLIKKGLVVTAAHCVAEFGNNSFYSNWQFVPALWGSTAPYGKWNVAYAYVMTSYLNGTDSCTQSGVVCKDDVAVLVIAPQNGVYPGTATGWLSYGVNGYGFTSTTPNIALISQLGYPVSHDSGLKMQRTDSQGQKTSTLSNNTVIGSRMTGGSSGGPFVVNLGTNAVLSGVTLGTEPNWNTVVGVTSWGYIDESAKEQGASPFLSTNIPVLVNSACAAYPDACAP